MAHNTSTDAVLDPVESRLNNHDTVVDVSRSGRGDDLYLIATVRDRVDKHTLKQALSNIPTPVYVDIQVKSAPAA